MNSTIYNGSNTCTSCGGLIGPIESMIDKKQCPSCRRQKHADHVKGRMA